VRACLRVDVHTCVYTCMCTNAEVEPKLLAHREQGAVSAKQDQGPDHEGSRDDHDGNSEGNGPKVVHALLQKRRLRIRLRMVCRVYAHVYAASFGANPKRREMHDVSTQITTHGKQGQGHDCP
jgi:hypothetical protein